MNAGYGLKKSTEFQCFLQEKMLFGINRMDLNTVIANRISFVQMVGLTGHRFLNNLYLGKEYTMKRLVTLLLVPCVVLVFSCNHAGDPPQPQVDSTTPSTGTTGLDYNYADFSISLQ